MTVVCDACGYNVINIITTSLFCGLKFDEDKERVYSKNGWVFYKHDIEFDIEEFGFLVKDDSFFLKACKEYFREKSVNGNKYREDIRYQAIKEKWIEMQK